MKSQYALQTTVPVEKTRAEIETVLGRYGAHAFGYMADPGRAMIAFSIKDAAGVNLSIRMTLPLPSIAEDQFRFRKRGGGEYPEETIRKNWEQSCRSAWRSLYLVIKAKLEACAAGISTVEREFLADVVTPTGQTVGEMVRPQLAAMSESGRSPVLMLEGKR